MVSKALRNATRIERKDSIPAEAQTPKRDEAADWIEEHAAENWGEWTFTDIADETEYSRQHIANTVEAYFRPADAGIDLGAVADADVSEVVGDGAYRDLLIYRQGYRDGWRDRGGES